MFTGPSGLKLNLYTLCDPDLQPFISDMPKAKGKGPPPPTEEAEGPPVPPVPKVVAPRTIKCVRKVRELRSEV